MKLPNGMTAQQIRVLQEFRRRAEDVLTIEELGAVTHPGGGGEDSATELVESGLLSTVEDGFSLTDKGREFLSRPSIPLGAEMTDESNER